METSPSQSSSLSRRLNLRDEAEDENTEVAIWIRWGLEPGAYGVDPSDYYL